MGAEQSSSRGNNRPEPTEKKTCYYELLGISRTATEEEIKKAYRRKALELHPDRNYGDVENATKLFAEIQTANEVLSDPQERAWYDSHRDAILNGESAGEYTQGQNIQVTSSSRIVALMSKFNSSTPFTDSPNGFYGSLRTIFQTLAEEEYTASEWEGIEAPEYPDFGSKEDINNYEDVVRPFYAVWTGFSTNKSFAWKDLHRVSEAPDRYIRRLMEKENKSLREKGIREFNDTVRALVLFARKRDPRYRPNTQSEADRLKALREASEKMARKARVANARKFAEAVVPEWSKSREGEEEEEEELFSGEEEDEEEVEVLRCDFCNKTFKSDKQFDAHEKSKKHTKIVQQVKRQMQKENKKFGLDTGLGSTGTSTPAVDPEALVENEEDLDHEDEPPTEEITKDEEDLHHEDEPPKEEVTKDSENEDHTPPEKHPPPDDDPNPETKAESPHPIESDSSSQSTNSDYAPRTTIFSRLTDDPLASPTASLTISESDQPKLGKAKAKRAKKAAAQSASVAGHVCGVCKEGFSSKTKLFKHVGEEGHAVPVEVEVKGGGKKKKGRK